MSNQSYYSIFEARPNFLIDVFGDKMQITLLSRFGNVKCLLVVTVTFCSRYNANFARQAAAALTVLFFFLFEKQNLGFQCRAKQVSKVVV